MFIKKFAENDFADLIEINLKNIESQDQLSEAECLDNAVNFIRLSADLLDEIGMEEQAAELTEMLEHLAEPKEDEEESESESESESEIEVSEDEEGEEESDESEEDEEDEEDEEKDDHGKIDDHFAKDSSKKKSKKSPFEKKTKTDSATKGLTSEKMVKNLKNKGWVFNAKDEDHHSSKDLLSVKEDCCTECGGVIDSMHAKDKKSTCEYCGESMDDDALFCSQYCSNQAQDCGMIYDCMDSWDASDAWDSNNAPKCKGWKKSPVGSPRQRSFCKRHCGMKKKLTSKKVADDPDSCINQGLRRWKCRCS